MARDGSGSYTLPSGNPVVSGQTISSTWANDTMTDLETEMTASLDRNGKGGMLAVLKGIDGVVGGPAYSFTNEATTGIYRAGSNDLRVSIAGTDRAKVNASGLAADTISELTADNGVAIDSVTLKDGGITAAGTIDFTGATITDLGTVTTIDIDGGTIDGAVIGGSSAAAGTFTALTSNGIDDNATSTAITIDSSDRVSIGTTDVPAAVLQNMVQDGLEIQSDTAGAASIYQYQYNNSGVADHSFYRAQGTKSSPAAVAIGDSVAQVWGGAYDGTDWHPVADMRYVVDGVPSDGTDMPGGIRWRVTPDASATLSEAMRINNDGTVSIGQTDAETYLTQRNWGGLRIEHNTAYKASIYLQGYETSVGNAMEIYHQKARGTKASPSTLVDGDAIAYHSFSGQTGLSTSKQCALMAVEVDGAVTTNNCPGRFAWYTTAVGGGSAAAEKMRLTRDGELLVGTTTAGASKLVVDDDSIQINTSKTPSSATDTGTTGQVAWDGSYIYVCIGTNQWRRAAISGGW